MDNLMLRRRGIMRFAKSIIPTEYQQVEYIEAAKRQYFVSDIEIQDGLTVDCIQSFNVGDTFLFGGYAGEGTNNRSVFNGCYGGSLQGGYPSGYYLARGSFNILGANQNIYHVVSTHKNGNRIIYVDDSLYYEWEGTTSINSNGTNCVVFGGRGPGAVGSYTVNLNYAYSGRVYSLKIYKDDTLLADYIPCYRKSDNKPGMYDLVLNKFYYSETETDFVIGPIKN